MIEFLSVDEVELLHREQLTTFSGQDGLRDRSALEAAVRAPEASFDGEYLYPDVFMMAAVYAFSISEAQAFIDGNKRTALYAALYFLAMNGYHVEDPSEVLYPMMLAIATKEIAKEKVAEILRWCACV